MRLYNVHGRLVNKSVSKYLIDWDGKCRSKFQLEVKQFFKEYWKYQICYEEFPVYGTRMKVDIVNATKKIAVEVNGDQHSSYNKFFHGGSRANYLKSIKRDWKKTEWLEKNDFQLIEIYPKDLNKLSPEYIEKKCSVSII
mgnify:FL=1